MVKQKSHIMLQIANDKKKFKTNTFQYAFSIVKGKHKEDMRLGHLGKFPSFVLVELFNRNNAIHTKQLDVMKY